MKSLITFFAIASFSLLAGCSSVGNAMDDTFHYRSLITHEQAVNDYQVNEQEEQAKQQAKQQKQEEQEYTPTCYGTPENMDGWTQEQIDENNADGELPSEMYEQPMESNGFVDSVKVEGKYIVKDGQTLKLKDGRTIFCESVAHYKAKQNETYENAKEQIEWDLEHPNN